MIDPGCMISRFSRVRSLTCPQRQQLLEVHKARELTITLICPSVESPPPDLGAMTGASEPSKALDVRKAPRQVLLDPDPAVSEIEQEPTVGTHIGSIGVRPPTLWMRSQLLGLLE